MKIIIPMAGMGKRMRPHTLTIPKPLIPIAGKSIVQRLVEDLKTTISKPIDEIAFVVGDFGKEVEESLCKIAHEMGSTCSIYYQNEPLGTAHAVLCAADSLKGEVVVAFADTLFRTSSIQGNSADAIIWVKEVENPSQFGVVKLNNEGIITDFIEKPQTPVSNLAIIGIYYFKSGELLRQELQYLIDHNIKVKGEYQLTDALQNMKNKGLTLKATAIDEWFDCGNKEATLNTTKRILELSTPEQLLMPGAQIINSVIIQPCFIGIDAIVENSIVGPYVSIGKQTHVRNSIIKDSIIQRYTHVENLIISNSIVGNNSDISGSFKDLNVGDYNTLTL
ncbi:MAG TPA: sugar phosphate nucleotidyltransferase [Bacteroidales bacterium]|nr:sugar phosphate nucleotidyltransferase [Bacteroidales bacterium]